MRKKEYSLAFLVENFFSDYLIQQRQSSRHTISSYRDTFRLLLLFVAQKTKKPIAMIGLEDLHVDHILLFLHYLEKGRGCSASSRNQRLAAIKSFFKQVNIRLPDKANLIHRVLCLESKRMTKKMIDFLSLDELQALLKAPDRMTWIGRRDHALLLFAAESGLRVSELLNVKRDDIHLEQNPHVFCLGKGRKERETPLGKMSVATMREWLKEKRTESLVFPNRTGGAMSADSVQYLIKKYQATAGKDCPSLLKKNLTPHVLRHTTAMNLLQAEVDPAVIALWLGHSSMDTTMKEYIAANLALKEKALSKMDPTRTPYKRYKPSNDILTYLEGV